MSDTRSIFASPLFSQGCRPSPKQRAGRFNTIPVEGEPGPKTSAGGDIWEPGEEAA